jgi:hypothetical protein
MTSSDNATNSISIEEDKEDKCSTKIGSAGMGFPREDRTECELEEWNKCKDLREDLRAAGTGKTWGARCDNVNELFMDNDCLGYTSQEECDNAFNDDDKIPPPCDENTPPGQLCRDEGDEDQDPNDIICPEAGPAECDEGSYYVDCDENPEFVNCTDDAFPPEESLFEEISTMIPPTPQLETTLDLNQTISDLLRLLLTQEVEGTDRIMIIAELEQVLQNLITNTDTQSVYVELETEDDGNTKVLTVTTSASVESAPIEEEVAPEEEEEDNSDDSGDNGGDNSGGDNNDPAPPPPEPEPPEVIIPEPPGEIIPEPPIEIPEPPPFG